MKFIASYMLALLAALSTSISKIAVGTVEEVDVRVDAFAAALEAEAKAEDLKASALREVAFTASLKSMAATQAARYRRGVALAVRETGPV